MPGSDFSATADDAGSATADAAALRRRRGLFATADDAGSGTADDLGPATSDDAALSFFKRRPAMNPDAPPPRREEAPSPRREECEKELYASGSIPNASQQTLFVVCCCLLLFVVVV